MPALDPHHIGPFGLIGKAPLQLGVKVGRAGAANPQAHSVLAGLGANTHKTVFVVADAEVANEQFKSSKGHERLPFFDATRCLSGFTHPDINKVCAS